MTTTISRQVLTTIRGIKQWAGRFREISAARLTAGLFSIAALGLTGCAHTNLTAQSMSFNKTVQDHRTQQLFLNVLRAAKHEPMALTAVTSISTTNSRSLKLGPFNWDFGPNSIGPHAGAVRGASLPGRTWGLRSSTMTTNS